MYYPFSWVKIGIRVIVFLVLLFLVGWVIDDLFTALVLGSVGLLLSNYFQIYRLNKWLWHSRKMSPPSVSGIWEHLYDGIYYLQRRNRNKRKELGAIVKRFREGSEALPDAAVVVDEHARIVWCNRLARIEMGLRWPTDAGMRLDNLIRHPDFVEYFQQRNFDFPIEVPSPLNSRKTFEYRIMPYGEMHLLLVARDVTRVSQLEAMRKDFVANVSHELRTPLTVMTGYLELISPPDNDPLMKKAIDEMNAQTQRMQSLIEDLLILSRIEASSDRIFEKTVSMSTMLTQIELETSALNREKQHSIHFDVEDGLLVFGVETELRSACSNLIFNAIHYTPSKGEIWIRWYQTDTGAKFSVTDNGDGIEGRHISRLTERFYRVDKARSRKTGGSGLGLSIVKHVLNHHNTHLEIQSEIKKGSTFSFELHRQLIADGVPRV